MRNYLIPSLAIVALLSGCDHPAAPQPRPTDDSPTRIAEDAADLPHLQFAKATTQPIAIRYQDDWGMRLPDPGEPKLYEYRAVFCAIWDDGLILWRQDPRDVRSPLLYARLESATIQAIRQQLLESDQQARALKMRLYVVPDGGYSTAILSFPGQTPICMKVWRDDDYSPAENPETYKAMLAVWNRIKTTLDSARPPTGQPISPGDVLWIERDGRQGVYKP
jgi:hypothetical protein